MSGAPALDPAQTHPPEGWRQRWLHQETSAFRFNVLQLTLMLLTLAAGAGATEQGLLGPPDMQITGHGSSAH